MRNTIRTPSENKKMSHLGTLPTGHRDADSWKVPFRTARNLKHCKESLYRCLVQGVYNLGNRHICNLIMG
jgi:hypothetical protein